MHRSEHDYATAGAATAAWRRCCLPAAAVLRDRPAPHSCPLAGWCAALPCSPACRPAAAAETWKWLLSILIGAVMGVLAFLVDWGIEAMNGFKFATVRAAVAESGEAPGWRRYKAGSAAHRRQERQPAAGPGWAGAIGACTCLPLQRLGDALGWPRQLPSTERHMGCFAECSGVWLTPGCLQAALWRHTSHTLASASCLPWWLAAWSGAHPAAWRALPGAGCRCLVPAAAAWCWLQPRASAYKGARPLLCQRFRRHSHPPAHLAAPHRLAA